jgi:NAD(P)-dependent dehydrogenase (short-subunit alcohol dehydrogenase family)
VKQAPSGPMAGRTVLVTGATAGIGKATALGLATMGAHLGIIGGPGDSRSRRWAGRRVRRRPAHQAEVQRLAEQILQTLSRIDAAKVIIEAPTPWLARPRWENRPR